MDIIYLRTSTEEQNPQIQLKDIIREFTVNNYHLLEEKQSAFDDSKERPLFEQLKKDIVQGKVKTLYVWSLDRIFRNRKKMTEFLNLCRIKKTKVYSFNERWLIDIQKAPEPWNEIMHNFLIEILGWLGESESRLKSNRVKMAKRVSKDGVTISYKGNKWGRKGISKQTITKIMEFHSQGHSIREISDLVKIYDSNNNGRNVSKSCVHKTISENEAKKVRFFQPSLFD